MARSPVSRSRQPLIIAATLARALQTRAAPANPTQRAAATEWAGLVRDHGFRGLKEEAIRSRFTEQVVVQVLGYAPVHPSEPFTMAEEEAVGSGSVDRALGNFSPGRREIVAPFELKGPATRDLDAIMPGRAKSPVQQAWEYAIDVPGAKWVLVSNCAELRLYAFGRGRAAYEHWNLAELDQPGELDRLCLLLSAGNLLGGVTDTLLQDSRRAEREVTKALYQDYKTIRGDLIEQLDSNNRGLGRVAAIEYAQTLLDRVLFIAVAEDTELLPHDTLQNAYQANNPYAPQPVWDNFKGLFQAIDKGNDQLGIPAYNGGLFAADPGFDSLSIPDGICHALGQLGKYDFATEVSVLILGRIFEQSISDIEALQAHARGEMPPTTAKKKREGVVYTPEFVTRFIVERTIGHTLIERFDALLAAHDGGREVKDGIELLTFAGGRDANSKERAFWAAYQDVLRRLTVLDPACGSGAFLIAAFDFLAAEYQRVNDRLANLGRTGRNRQISIGTGSLFDPDREILTGNLFGVDVSRESVEITKLSLWLKTAKRGKALESLEPHIRVGNSLIEDTDYHQRAFAWREAFPAVFAQGGFDVVIGNPPYVRMELIKPFKPYLQRRYEVVADRADLYAYFYELGLRNLKPGGRLGFISSSTFFRTGSGAPLRQLLANRTEIEDVIDFGDLQLFEGVTTYPAIVVMQKPATPVGSEVGQLRFLQIQDQVPEELSRRFEQEAIAMPRTRLGRGGWQFEGDAAARLRAKLRAGHPTLRDVYGTPLRGIVTGLNEAFVVDRATRDRLAVDDAHTALLVPFLRGEDIKRWHVESDDLWLINIPKGQIRIEDYPAIQEHLLPYKARLEARATKQAWYELQQAQVAYHHRMRQPKILYPHFADRASYAPDTKGYFSNNKTFFIPNSDPFLLGILNARPLWFVFAGLSPAVRGGFYEHAAQFIEWLPIPNCDVGSRERVGQLAQEATDAAAEALALEREVLRRIPDLCPPDREPRLPMALRRWWELDFQTFRDRARKAFKADVPLRERGAWEEFLASHREQLFAARRRVAAAERDLDRIVCGLFDLAASETALLP